MKIQSIVSCSLLQLCIGTLTAFPGFARAAPAKEAPSILGVNCSDVFKFGLDKQENLRAGMIRIGCGLEPAGAPGLEEGGSGESVLDFTNINLITGPEILPNVTQSESMVWANGQTIVVNYNDSKDVVSSPLNISGVSVSIDSGASFARLIPSPFATGHQANFGDPIVVYNGALGMFFAGDLVTGCGGQGIGLWTSADGLNWSTGACAHNGSFDDRESMWVDNNPGSPFFGRMYISWNDFSAGQFIYVTHSDDGTVWTTPFPVTAGFIRNIQLTGSSGSDGTVFIAGMDEHGGLSDATRTNWMYRSSNGGGTWQSIQMGPDFSGPGSNLCGYFWAIAPIWRHMGWGQPAVGPNGVVHYAYSGRGVNPSDLGDIFYTQSLDNGDTWSTPIILNTDTLTGGNRAQWMPSLSVTPEGKVLVTWYDRRNSDDGSNYEYFGIQSPDNGVTWGPDFAVTDVLVHQPEQPDPQIQSCYAGDYNYQTTDGINSYAIWTDGRNPISGHFQQDVYFAAIPQGAPTGGLLQGQVVSDSTGDPIAGARVRAVGPVDRIAFTNATGNYTLRLSEGTYDVTVTAFAYSPGSTSGVPIVEGQSTTQSFALTLAPVHSVSGTVTNSATGLTIAGAQVRILSTPLPPATTDANGMYQFPIVPEGTYNIHATTPGFLPSTQSITVDQDVVVNFALDSVAACDHIAGNLVVNCGFETGDFTAWTRSGDPSATLIDAFSAHTGNFGLDIGPVNDLGFIAQNLATTPSGSYSLCYWLLNQVGTPNRFQVSWDGTVLRDDSDLPQFDYTQYCVDVVASSDSTELKFGFLQVPTYFYFDDVSVSPQ